MAAWIKGDDAKLLELSGRILLDEGEIALSDTRYQKEFGTVGIAPFPHVQRDAIRGSDAMPVPSRAPFPGSCHVLLPCQLKA